MAMHLPAIITLFSLLLFFGIVIYVGYARSKYGIKVPATTGSDNFERIFRVQMNTLENLIQHMGNYQYAPSLKAYYMTSCAR